MLQLSDVTLRFAGLTALDGVSFEVPESELLAVIGPNGAGKTSLFNCICGLYRPQEGQIRFHGDDLLAQPVWRRSTLGIGRMFQNIALYDHLTVLENLMVGRHHTYTTSILHDLFRTSSFRREEIRHRARVEEILDFLNLESVRDVPAMVLPYGLLKRVELGRALATEPRLLLLDEPAAGLNQEETEDMARYLLDIREELHITQILIEHDLRLVLDLADRVVVLDFGRKIAQGTPAEIRTNPDVEAAYTGGLS